MLPTLSAVVPVLIVAPSKTLEYSRGGVRVKPAGDLLTESLNL